MLVAYVAQPALLNLCYQVGLFDVREGDVYGRFGCGLLCLALLFDGREVDREYTVCELRETALPLLVLVDRSEGLKLDQTALKPGEVFGPEELALQSRRGDLQGVFSAWDEVFYVEYGAEVLCKGCAVFVSDTGEHLDWRRPSVVLMFRLRPAQPVWPVLLRSSR